MRKIEDFAKNVAKDIHARKLDYEFAEKLPVKEIISHLEEHHFNVLGVVIKDTDGACMWDTKIGWNPTDRDILGEFVDAGKDSNIWLSFTCILLEMYY